jgi:hypothetical protein
MVDIAKAYTVEMLLQLYNIDCGIMIYSFADGRPTGCLPKPVSVKTHLLTEYVVNVFDNNDDGMMSSLPMMAEVRRVGQW